MNRWIAWLLLLVLLPVLPAAAGEDRVSVLTGEPWVSQEGIGFTFSADGTGVMKQKDGSSFSGTWKMENGDISFTYRQYGTQTWKGILFTYDEDPRILSSGVTYYQESVMQRKRREAAEKRYALKWDELVRLGFMQMKLSHLNIYRAHTEALPKITYTLKVEKGRKYLVFSGLLKNLAGEEMYVDRIKASVIVNGKTFDADVRTTENNEFYTYSIPSGKNQKIYFIAAVPEAAVKNLKSAELRLNFYDQFKSFPHYAYDGDYFFSLKATAARMAAAQKTAARKKAFFKENKDMPVPTGYVDVVQSSYRYSVKEELTGRRAGFRYLFYPRYSDGNNKKLFDAYMNALKKAGYTVQKIRAWNAEAYTVSRKNAQVGGIKRYANSKYFEVYVIRR